MSKKQLNLFRGMINLSQELKKYIEGDVLTDDETIETYSRDTSLFKVTPEVVVFPKHTEDVKSIVRFVRDNKGKDPNLSITGRSAGSDMTGGPLNSSIILGFTKYFTRFDVNEEKLTARVEPGVFYRKFEKETLPEHLSVPVYPASKDLAAFGGMIMNNCGGEKTLRYGQMRNFVRELTMVLSDGNEYVFSKLSRSELEEKKSQINFEGALYRQLEDLLIKHEDVIEAARPRVSKNSSGYALWDVYDKENDTFDLTQLFTGSQGTLGICTSAQVRLVEEKPHKRLISLFFKSWDDLPGIVNALLPFKPMSLETFDDQTLKLGIRFMPGVAKRVGVSFFDFALSFLPEFSIGVRMLGLPKLIILVELEEDSQEALDEKTKNIKHMLKERKVIHRVLDTEEEMDKYWVMRRESFSLLRQHVGDKKTAPFVEDFCVSPDRIPEFLPKALSVLNRNGIKANIAGHAGNGNFHIIPLMDLRKKEEREKILRVADAFYSLVVEYGGSISAEHNDGIMRTPYVEEMFGEDMYGLFKKVKEVCDPQNIFNPGKKVGGSKEYLEKHIA